MLKIDMFRDISPSKMPRIVHCPGSVNLCRQFNELSTEISGDTREQGILAHWLWQQKLTQGIDLWQFLNQSPINDQVVDREMIVHVSNYCGIVMKIGRGQIEQKYEIVEGEFIGFGGTPDFIFYNQESNMLTILDLKYGFIPVAALKNWQLLSYAWLFHNAFPELPINSIKLGIYQPRIQTKDGIYKIWEFPFQEVYFQKIQESLRSCQSTISVTRAGEHCHYCPAMLQCDTNLRTCLKIVNLGNIQHGEEPTGEQLSAQLKLFRFASAILKKRLQVIESVTQVRLRKGESVPGYRLDFSNGKRYMDITDSRAERIGWPKQPAKFMSPRQAEINGFPKNLIDKNTNLKMSTKLTEIDIDQINERLKNG